MTNTEKIPYLVKRDRISQPYQILVILENLSNTFCIWEKTQSNSLSESIYYRTFIPIVKQVLADTDTIVKDGESKSICSVRHMQWNGELYDRKSATHGGYEYGRKIDFILKDKWNNELNTCEFKKKNAFTSVIFDQQVKNLWDNAAVFIESKKATIDSNINVMGIDCIGDTGHLYRADAFEDVRIASAISILNTPCNLASLNNFDETLNSLKLLENKLVEFSNEIKVAREKETRKFDFVDVFDDEDEDADSQEVRESSVFHALKSKKLRASEQEE